YDAFVAAYCIVNSFTLQITGTRPDKIPELKAMLATIMLRRTRKEVAPEMPEIGFEFLEIKPTSGADINTAGMSDDAFIDAGIDGQDRIAVATAK
ncbi:hypothetical protein LAJ57_12660, partial [Streptococcus pneumoniae]|uniref:hypothetical protein n=1 Tax=Streptococcus pneumoniae TaxID=1313 RepID=UPI001CBE3415